jgi:3-dehydroquinate dehydratase / shikimate dehydrogenase
VSGRCRLCLCVTGATLEEDLRLVDRYRRHVDAVELRADFLSDTEAAAAWRFPALTGLPCILTVRRPSDGGRFRGSEAERVSLLGRILAGQGRFAWVDLESGLDAPDVDAAASASGAVVIRSLHDTEGTPRDPVAILSSLARSDREIPKLAVNVRSVADLERLLPAFRCGRIRDRIVVGMGPAGFPTRVLAPVLGGCLAYSSAPGMDAAPGHVDPEAMDATYRFHRIGPSSRIFGVIGNPIGHSLSPHIHNAGYDALGIDAVYAPFLVDDVPAFLRVADLLGMTGVSVTVPHKETVVPLLSKAEPPVPGIGACNTLVRGGPADGWTGYNTDAEGFLDPLRRVLGARIPAGLRAAVIGAGGVARAVVAALAGQKARVLVLNRTEERAASLARTFGVEWAALDAAGLRSMADAELIVQTTTVGMEPDDKRDPVPAYRFRGSQIAYDLVFKPAETVFLRRAKAAGCRIIGGKEMLLSQAYAQFFYYTGKEYPREIGYSILDS